MGILERMNGHSDLVGLNADQRKTLCGEIREFLIESISHTGGHLASNLGVVELSVALETVFDTSKDRLVFDVGHQSYVHKLLTGRRAAFSTLRKYNGMAGFPKPSESETDAFVAGHASSSVSIALGMARARTLRKESYSVVTVLGDGAATGGMVYEALNDAAVSKEPLIVILNDNAMSIDTNVGGFASHLARLRTQAGYLGMKAQYRNLMTSLPGGTPVYKFTRRTKNRIRRAILPTTIFETMGMTYLGPVDGHDTESLISLLTTARNMQRPVLLHITTQKGRGYALAEKDPARYHGVNSFDAKVGIQSKLSNKSFSEAFGSELCRLAQEEKRICAVTAAMPSGTGLMPFKKAYPDRFFDVGIAEEHAVSMAGGMAKQGMLPVVALYSTFLQRSYDMIMQDVAMLRLPVILAVDRAGLVGEDGETHHGIFDVGFLRQVPGMRVLCPASCAELQAMLRSAVSEHPGPTAIRYPRGGDRDYHESAWRGFDEVVCTHRTGGDVTIITYGTLIQNAMEAAELLAQQGVEATVLRLLSIGDIPTDEILSKLSDSRNVFIMEEVCGHSSIREELAWQLHHRLPDCRIAGVDLGRSFVTHGDLKSLYRHYGLDAASVCSAVLGVVNHED